MKKNRHPLGRGAQTLSFLVVSSVLLICFAQVHRINVNHAPKDFVTAGDSGQTHRPRNNPKAFFTMGDLSEITITIPNLTSSTSHSPLTDRTAVPTMSKTAAASRTAVASTMTTTSKTTTASKTTTTSKVTTTSKKTTTTSKKTTTTSKKTTTTSKRTTTTSKKTTTTSKKTTTTSKKNSSNIPPNKYNESKYYIVVYKGSQSTVVYGKDDDGNYTRKVKTFTCSTGKDSSPTRTGTYKIRAKYRWRYLVGGVYGQYSSSISSSYLFHSVPYYKQNVSSLENEEYDKLGSPASKGCIRMCVRDCKWIYDNCPIGTEVNIVNQSGPSGPGVPRRKTDEAYSGWDPSDKWAQGNPYFS